VHGRLHPVVYAGYGRYTLGYGRYTLVYAGYGRYTLGIYHPGIWERYTSLGM